MVAVLIAALTQSPQYDILVRGGRVLDGTGNPWVRADVAVRNGRIVAIGRLDPGGAARIVDATGKLVAPGFIDMNSHADDGASSAGGLRDPDPKRRAALNLVTQGVTTVVVNQDGRSPWPIRDQRSSLERQGIGPNAALMVGHGTVRLHVMGRDYRRGRDPADRAGPGPGRRGLGRPVSVHDQRQRRRNRAHSGLGVGSSIVGKWEGGRGKRRKRALEPFQPPSPRVRG